MNILQISEFEYEKHKEKLGFFFLSNVKSPASSIKNLCDKLIVSKVAKNYPSAIYQMNNLVIFIYDGGFDAPVFFQMAQMPAQIAQCQIGTILELKEVLTRTRESV